MIKGNNKAFTLIEILLVTSIVSLLSSVVSAQYNESRLKSHDAHMKQESHQIANAINLYKNDNNGRVPVSNIQKIDRNFDIVYENDPVDGGSAYRSSMQKLVDGGYLPSIPTSPDGKSYGYYVTEDEKNAMFSVELNFADSTSGKNSCDFVEVESSYIGNPFAECDEEFFIDPEDPNVIVSDANILCPVFGTPSGPGYGCEPGYSCFGPTSDVGYYPDGNSSLGTYFCPYAMMGLTASMTCRLNDYGQNECSTYNHPHGGIGLQCNSIDNNVQCDGSSNSDHCSCI